MSASSPAALTVEAMGLPSEGIDAARSDGAAVFAFAARARDGRLRGLVAARRRRSSLTIRVTRFLAEDGVADQLVQALVDEAHKAGALEIRALDDQVEAIEAFGMQPSGRGYARLWLRAPIAVADDVGSYNQTTGFTCGPVSLAMALKRTVTRADEVAIWREATTLIGLTGPGGCDPYGLALAARRRATAVTLYVDTDDPVLLDRANTEEKRDLMRFVQGEFKREALSFLDIVPSRISPDELCSAIRSGARVLVLIDQYHIHGHTAPHWVLVHAAADSVFLVNDPWMDVEDGEVAADTDCVPIEAATLDRLSRYGDPPYSAAIVIDVTGDTTTENPAKVA